MSCRIERYVARNGWMGVVSRLLVGATFVFSSVSKAVEPYGTVLKVEEYLHAMGLEALMGGATLLAVGLIGFEMLLGAALVLGALPRVTSRVAVAFGALFSLFTLWVALKNPVAECGCFGDVVTLTNWQTFGKNVVLLALSIVALWSARDNANGDRCRVVGALGMMTLAVAFSIWGLTMLPVVERFPFGEGVNIAEAAEREMTEEDESYVVCRSTTTGEERRFAPDDSEWWNEELWEFVRTEAPEESLRVRARDFRIVTDEYDLTEQVLLAPICRLVCVERVESLSEREREKIYEIARRCMSLGDRVVIVSASPLARVGREFMGFEVGNMDAVTLRALVRAREGIVTIQRGTIIHKTTLRAAKVES